MKLCVSRVPVGPSEEYRTEDGEPVEYGKPSRRPQRTSVLPSSSSKRREIGARSYLGRRCRIGPARSSVDPDEAGRYGLSVEIFKEFTFEAAHRLPHVAPDHKCSRLHGHSFRISVHLTGPVGAHNGWVRDFQDVSCAMAPLLAVLDHYYLNEIEGLENPTSEVLARWIWERLSPSLPELSQVVVRETCNSGCVYRGEP